MVIGEARLAAFATFLLNVGQIHVSHVAEKIIRCGTAINLVLTKVRV
jgi:hypothetical protein